MTLTNYRNEADGSVAWTDFFRAFEAVALLANSPAVDLARIVSQCPARTLYVFFNEADRVVHGEFGKDAILIARSGRKGSAIVGENKLAGTVALFAPAMFHGVVNLKTSPIERFDPASAYTGHAFAYLDLIPFFDTFYPVGKTASSGFAVAAWLGNMGLERPVYLFGFTGTRTERWKLFDIHDWTFEQVALRLLVRKGRLHAPNDGHMAPDQGLSRLAALVSDATMDEIALVASDVLSDRVGNLAHFIDRLWSVTRFGRWISASLADARGRKQDRR